MKQIGIYSIINNLNGKRYIGQTVDYLRRKKTHKYRLTSGNGFRKGSEFTRIFPAVQKYGWDNFRFEWLESCTKEQLNDREIFWIAKYDTYNNGYNATKGGNNPVAYWKGKKRSAEDRAKVSKGLTGKKASAETRAKMSKSASLVPHKFGQGRYRSVICIETGIKYPSVLIAAQSIGCSQSAIHRHLKGQWKQIKGYTFKYGVETIPQGSRQEDSHLSKCIAA